MRITDVRPIDNLLAISAFETPWLNSFFTFSVWLGRSSFAPTKPHYELKTSQEIVSLEPAMSITFLDDVMDLAQV